MGNKLKKKIEILQQHINVGSDDNTNYLVIVETVDNIPQRSYVVCMHNFIFYHETMPFYVINQN